MRLRTIIKVLFTGSLFALLMAYPISDGVHYRLISRVGVTDNSLLIDVDADTLVKFEELLDLPKKAFDSPVRLSPLAGISGIFSTRSRYFLEIPRFL